MLFRSMNENQGQKKTNKPGDSFNRHNHFHRINKTRTLNDGPETTPPKSVITGNGHRIVMGRGARKALAKSGHPMNHNVPMKRPMHTPSHNTLMKKHVAGARMSVVRKEMTKNRGRGPAKPLNNQRQGTEVIPPLAPRTIRIVPLGGVEEVGKNMTAIEYENDIIVIDIGFQFKEEGTPGIDYILPNTKYLEEDRKSTRLNSSHRT